MTVHKPFIGFWQPRKAGFNNFAVVQLGLVLGTRVYDYGYSLVLG